VVTVFPCFLGGISAGFLLRFDERAVVCYNKWEFFPKPFDKAKKRIPFS
jgi:hypothetical protein